MSDPERAPAAARTPPGASSSAEPRRALNLPRELRAELEARARDGYPFEICGLLIGRAADRRTEVVEIALGRNLASERPRDRYRLDPADQLAAELRARALGLDVVGVWHTHPDRPARPSETDRSGAYAGYSYLILAVTAAGVQDARSFRLAGETFLEEDLGS